MDPIGAVSGAGAFLIAAVVVVYVIIAGVAHRHRWTTALQTAERLLQGRDLQAVQRALASDEVAERLGAALVIGEDKTEETADLLIEALADPETEVRVVAAAGLSQRKGRRVVAELRRVAIDDEHSLPRLAAIRSLGTIGSPEAVPELIAALEDSIAAPFWRGSARRDRALAAIDALGQIGGSKAATALAAAQASGRREVRRAAAGALRLLGLTAKAKRADADAAALKELAAMHVKRGDDEAATRWLKKAAEMQDADAEVFHLLGLLHQRQERWREAEECYQRAIQLDPREAFPYFGLGVIYRSKNKTDKALRSLRTYVELAPSGQRARAAAKMIKELEHEG